MSSREEHPFTLLPPPTTLPEHKKELMPEISYFGITNFASGVYGSHDTFGIKREDRRRHLYIIGKSGMGKTSLLEQVIRYDMVFGVGAAVIDPHGDLAKNLIRFVPKEWIDRVIYIDPSDREHPIAFNPFASVPVEFRQNVAHGLIEIFKKQFASSWTPRIEHLFRFAALAMLEYEQGTLYGLHELLVDAKFRQKVIASISDDMVKRFFSIEFSSFSQKYDQEAITPLTNRLGQFFADPLLRTIFSSPENKIDFDWIMNSGIMLIVNAAKGVLGEENSALFASFFLTKLEQTAMARTTITESERKPFYLYVDEFQNVATRSFIGLFSESRKYGIHITVANQYLGQIQPDLIDAIFGNVGTTIAFRLSGADGDRLAKEFQPLVKPEDLINLGARDFYVKMSIDGKTTPPFSAKTVTLESLPEVQNDREVMVASFARIGQTFQNRKEETTMVLPLEEDTTSPDENLPPPL